MVVDLENNIRHSALITGGAKRIGREIALCLAEQGYDIALHYNASQEEAEELREEITALNVKCEIFQADISDMQQCDQLMDKVIKRFPDLSLLVNNASIFDRMRFEDTSEEFLDQNFAVHFKAPFFLSQKFSIFLGSTRKGNVINVTDSNTRRNSVEFFGYMLSKKSLNDLTKQLARILAPNVRVNAIAPGTILPSIEMTEQQISEKVNKLPLQDIASPQDISNTIMQILENSAITGHIFYLDGGEHLVN